MHIIVGILHDVIKELQSLGYAYRVDVEQSGNDFYFHIYVLKGYTNGIGDLFTDKRSCDFYITIKKDSKVDITYNPSNPKINVGFSKGNLLETNSSPQPRNALGKGELKRIYYDKKLTNLVNDIRVI